MQHRYGGPETLELEEVSRPTAGSDQVLVRAGLGHRRVVDELEHLGAAELADADGAHGVRRLPATLPPRCR